MVVTLRKRRVQGSRKGSPCRQDEGFALVATLMLMVLLALVALGLLGLSTVVVRSEGHGVALAEARANARLGMILALGELQEHLGPDRRASVPAESLQEVVPSGVDQDWSAVTAVLAPGEGDDAEERYERGFRRWLVSGHHDEMEDLASAASAIVGDTVALVEPTATSEGVRAGLMGIEGPRRGRYAWWVEDLGTKASMGLPGQSDPALRLRAPDRFGLEEMAGLPGLPPRDAKEWERLPSLGSVDLMAETGERLREAERPVSLLHRGLLVDTVEGRLKRDLTVALGGSRGEMEDLLGEQVYLPVSAHDSDPGGPRWELFRQYYQSGGTDDVLRVGPQRADQAGYYPVIAGLTEIYGLSNTVGYAPSAKPHPSLDPAYYNIRPGNKKVHVMTFHFAPVVKLWNPYDKPLSAPDGYTVSVANGDAQHARSGGDGSYQDIIYWGRDGKVITSIDARPPKTVRFEHRYYIPPVTIGPGEVRVFSLARNQFLDLDGTYRPHTGRELGSQTSVVKNGWILGELADITYDGFGGYSFWDMMFTKRKIPASSRGLLNWGGGRSIGGAGGTDTGDIQVLDTQSPGGLGFEVVPHPFTTWSVSLYEGKARLLQQGTPDAREPLVRIRNANTNTTGFRKGNTSFVANPDPTSHPLFLDPSGQDSIWARRLVMRQILNEGDEDPGLYNPADSPTKDARWLANYNPRSPTVGCWAFEHQRPERDPRFTGPRLPVAIDGKLNRGTRGYGLGTPGNYLTGMLPELVSRDALFLNSAIGFSDFSGPERCVLFETPGEFPERHFFSVGQLRHANVWIENGSYAKALADGHGAEDWFSDNMHPAWPVGNSYADPRLDPDLNEGLFRHMAITDERASYESVHQDLSYFLNRHLWDAYFFSALRDGEGRSYNSRLSRYGGTPPETGQAGCENNAARLMVDGAFNINSVSTDAWVALLSSLKGVPVGRHESENAVFPVVSTDPQGEVSGFTPVDEVDQYAGFRALDSAEVQDLAERIVEEIQERGPVLSLGEFVNRRIDGLLSEHRLKGALQAAIDETEINEGLEGGGDYIITEGEAGAVYDREASAGDIAAGIPGYLSQANVFARLGHLMAARSDTFTIRARGESLDRLGKVVAVAVCEATVQRVPEYVDPGIAAIVPYEELSEGSPAKVFGRGFRVVAFRWLAGGEI